MDPGRRRRHARGDPDDRARLRPAGACGSPTPQQSEAEALGYTVVDGESVIVTHLTETIRRTPPTCSPARTCARCSTSSRSPTRRSSTRSSRTCCRSARSSACCSALLAEGVSIRDLGDDHRGGRRQGADHPRPQPAGRVRPSGARPRDHRPAARRRDALHAHHARPRGRAGGRRRDHPDRPTARYLALEPDARPGARRGDPRRSPTTPPAGGIAKPGAALLGARPPPPSPHARVDRASAAVCSYNEISPGITVDTVGVIRT